MLKPLPDRCIPEKPVDGLNINGYFVEMSDATDGLIEKPIKSAGMFCANIENAIFLYFYANKIYMTFVDVPLLHLNLIGSYTPIWLMAGCSAFNILLFRNFFNSIPMSYLEAAKIDGCTDLGIFKSIIIPLSKPIIIVISIFSITHTWGNFMWPFLILGNTEKEPVAVMLYKLQNNGSLMENEYMMLLFISIIPMIIM